MKLRDIQLAVKNSGHAMVVFHTEGFPLELRNFPMHSNDKYIRYAPKDIDAGNTPSYSSGWYSTSFDYSIDAKVCNILITDFHKFMNAKKLRLLNAIKDFK